MLQYDVKLCPTLTILDQIDQLPNYWYPNHSVTRTFEKEGGLKDLWSSMVEAHTDALKNQLGIQSKMVQAIAKTYADLGGRVVAGTDTPGGVWNIPGMALHRELELFVEIGFTEMETLQATTNKAAQSIGMFDIGRIQEGCFADLIILNKNPLEDIRHTQSIDFIVMGGHIYAGRSFRRNTE